MEPFSTTVLKVLTRVFATTTKICTEDGSSRARARTFDAVSTPSYSPRHTFLCYLAAAAGYGLDAEAPSIFRASCFGR